MADDDVIEIGEDGAFDIPTTSVKVSDYSSPFLNEPNEDDKRDDNLEHDMTEYLSTIPVGTCKVLRSQGSNHAFVVARLGTDKTVTRLGVTTNDVKFYLASGDFVAVDLKPFNVDYRTAHANKWNDFVVVRFQLN